MRLILNKEHILNVIVTAMLLLVLFSAYPYVFCQFLPFPHIKILSVVFLLIFSVILLLRRKIQLPLFPFSEIILIQSLFWTFFCIYHNDSSYITRVFFIMIAYLSILCIHNTSIGVRNFLQFYSKFILGMAIGGTLCFFLVFLFSFTPIFNFENVDGRTAYCFGLTCTNAYIGNVIRYAGYFDEPGAMAYWGIFALLFNRLFFYNEKFERVLMFCLIFTFSVAYYIQVVFYILFFYVRQVKHFFMFLFSAAIIIGGIYLSKDTDFDIYRFTIYRFEMDESTGTIQGDSRSELTEKAKKQFEKAPILGIGAQHFTEIDYMADNPYEILAKDGIVGEIITYLPLLMMVFVGLKKGNKNFLYAAIILAIGYLQRPFHVDLIHPMMLYMMALLTIMYNKNSFCRRNEQNTNINCNGVL